jgi:hypothetical protein
MKAEIYLYARVGTEDAFAFPDLLAGSVVRIDKREPDRFLPLRKGQSSRVLFLVEHANGMVCCRLRRTDKRRVTLHTAELPRESIVRRPQVIFADVYRPEREGSQRCIADGNWIKAPKLQTVGGVKVRLWSDRDIERAHQLMKSLH